MYLQIYNIKFNVTKQTTLWTAMEERTLKKEAIY